MWCADLSLGGSCVWGALDADDITGLERALTLDLRDLPEFDLLLDYAEVEPMSADAFGRLVVGIARCFPTLAALPIRRVAAVAPTSTVGRAFVLGLPTVGVLPPFRMCESSVDALDWLGRRSFAAELREIVVRAKSASPTTSVLERWLRTHARAPSLEAAAAAMGRSARTLQRELAASGTSFKDEVARVRMAAAKDRLASTDEKISAIANTLGYRSPEAFATAFARATGTSPTAYRALHGPDRDPSATGERIDANRLRARATR